MAKKLKSLIILLIAIGLAYWFARGIDWPMVGRYLRHANWGLLLLGSVLINSTLILRSIRWQWFLKPITRANFWDALAATVMGFGCIFLVGRAGDLVRPIMLSLRSRIQPSATIATILIERLYDMTAVGLLFAANLLVIELPENNLINIHQIRVLGLLMLLGLGLGIALLILLRIKSQVVIDLVGKLLRWLPRKILNFVMGLLAHLADGLSVLLNVQALLTTIIYTAVIWGIITIAYWCVVEGFGIDFSLSQAVFMLGAGLVGSLIPTPGGSAGAFHVAAQKGLMVLGVEQNLAASISIAVHFISFGSPFIWALFYLMRTDLSIKELREMAIGETANSRYLESQATDKTAGI